MAGGPATVVFYNGGGYPHPYARQPRSVYDSPAYSTTPLGWQRADSFLTDPNTGTRTHVGGCESFPYTLPNRIQIYKMHIGSHDNILQFATGTLTAISDYRHESE